MVVRFPHFTLEEAKVLDEFQKRKILVGKWSYDVRLKSKKSKLPGDVSDWVQRMWESVTAKRIDAVCETENKIHLIEVKRYMLASGVGQLLVYMYMYQEQFKPFKPLQLWYVCFYSDPDIVEICRKLGIKTWSIY